MIGERQRIHGIVLAGVHAWGESVLERACPRPLLPVVGRPLIWFALDWLRQGGVSGVTVCANSDTNLLRGFLGNGESVGIPLDYYEDVMPRGPAGCVRDAAYRSHADLFVIVEGTILPQIDLPAVLDAHRQSRAVLTVVATQQTPVQKGRQMLEPTGIYVVSKQALELVPAKGYQDIKEMWIPRMYQHGCPAASYQVSLESALRVNDVGSYLIACARALGALVRNGECGKDYRRLGTALVHGSACIDGTVRISGDVLIGPNVTVETDAAVIGPTVLGPDSHLEPSAVVSEVVAWSNCRVGRGVILNRCILLNGSAVGAGLVVRDTIWCGEEFGSPLSGDWSSYWAMSIPELSRPGEPTPVRIEGMHFPKLSLSGVCS